MLEFLGLALGAVLFIEGALYALMPERMKRLMTVALSLPSETLRRGGVVAALSGVALLWLTRGIG